MYARGAVLVLLGWLAASPAAAAPQACVPVVVETFSACLGRAAEAIRRCAQDGGTDCGAGTHVTGAADRLRRKVVDRCPEPTLRDAHFPPPTAPAAIATRLADACLANASLLVERSREAVAPTAAHACFAKLTAASTRLARRTFEVSAACTLAGDGCQATRVAERIASAEERARRAVTRRCRHIAQGEATIAGVLARARAQMACALARVLPASAPCAPSGSEALVDLWSLPAPRPSGSRVAQVSSYDRSGGNADLGIGPDTAPLLAALGLPPVELDFSYLYREGDRYVIFDETGPGVVWRIWMTGLDALFLGGLAGDLQFELDDEETPRLVLDREVLFAGATPPFLAPLAGDLSLSSGGFYSIVPIAFARRLRISTSTVPNWVQVTYSRLPPDQAVASFDPGADTARVAALLAQAGEPSTTVAPSRTDEVTVSVDAGAESNLWERSGSGTVVRLELMGAPGADVPPGLRLRATFDAAGTPQIDVPLDDLFGASLGTGAHSLAFGQDGERWYCYFPMPFENGARVTLRNDGASAFVGWRLRVGSVDDLPPGPSTRLHAAVAMAHLLPDGTDYVLLDARGSGHVVGIVLTAGCGEAGACQLSNLPGPDGAHLEGDERITLDGSRWPQIHGTGLEDFFSGGFYFLAGPFALPTHGNPAQVPLTSPRRPGLNLRSAYRLFLGDAIPFRDGIRLAIEHGPTNDVPADFSSVVFYYAEGATRLVESDRLTIGNAGSEAAHALTADGRTDVMLSSAFRGDASDQAFSRSGMIASRTHVRMAVDPTNRGVRLRRLADLGAGTQAARVTVNGAPAGVWRTTEVNPFTRWADLDLELPAALTAGHSEITIELDAAESPHPWTAFEYVTLSHLP